MFVIYLALFLVAVFVVTLCFVAGCMVVFYMLRAFWRMLFKPFPTLRRP